MQARDIMETEVETVAPDDAVTDVLKRFARVDFSGFPVVDAERYVLGVVTESDLVDLFEPEEKTLWIPIGLPPFVDTLTYQVEAPWDDLDMGLDFVRNTEREIREVMTTDLVTVEPDADLDTVVDLLSGDDPNINRVPVVDGDGRIVGIIARQDLIRALRDERRN